MEEMQIGTDCKCEGMHTCGDDCTCKQDKQVLYDGYLYIEGYDPFPEFVQRIQKNLDVSEKISALYSAYSDDLFKLFLENINEHDRQHYNCNACRRFINTYGNLVVISEGKTKSALWWNNDVPEIFKDSIIAMNDNLKNATIHGVFIAKEETIGTKTSNGWDHLYVTLAKRNVNQSGVMTAKQIMAEKKEDYRILQSSIEEYSLPVVEKAWALLQTDQLFSSEKVLGAATWFRDLLLHISSTKNISMVRNYLWEAVASAPAGFCHVKTNMIGTLLDDLNNDVPLHILEDRFKKKIDPYYYRKSVAPPSESTKKRAEEIVAALGAESAFARRYATFNDIKPYCNWTPKEEVKEVVPAKTGLFANIKTKETVTEEKVSETAMKDITLTKFIQTIVPEAESIEMYIPASPLPFVAITAPVHPDAANILQWDNKDDRNPFSWYVYTPRTSDMRADREFVKLVIPSAWNIQGNTYVKVNALCNIPCHWKKEYSNFPNAVIFILDGAKDSNAHSVGNTLFSSTLISEFHEVRSVIDAYAKESKIEGYENASACGLAIYDHFQRIGIKVRVRIKGIDFNYNIATQ